MLDDLLKEELIETNKNCVNWQEAIHLGCSLLLNKGYIDEKYEETIIKNIKDIGPYMLIMPNVILSHARPEDGVRESSISFVTLKKGVNFGDKEKDPVKLIITLASKDKESHIKALTKLVDLFRNKEDLNIIFSAKNKKSILKIIKKYK